MDELEAIEVALAAYKRPQMLRLAARAPLPKGILNLIKLAAESPDQANKVVADETATQLPVREAAVIYLQHVLSKADDDFRQLGLEPEATLAEIKDHKRWLLKWLHPDRNRNSWESSLFQRVATSAERLERAARDQGPAFAPKTPHHRRRKSGQGQWQIAQRRVAKKVGWQRRLIKVGVAAIVLVGLVAVAQLGLELVQAGRVKWAFYADPTDVEKAPASTGTIAP